MNIKEQLNHTIQKYPWVYYPGYYSCNQDILRDKDCACAFIRNILQRGGKGDLQILNYLNDLEPSRIIHIVSLYFWGLSILENVSLINTSCKNYISNLKKEPFEEIYNDFLYLWMLICFFHDLGYVVEEGKISFSSRVKPYFSFFPKGPVTGIPSTYNKTLFKNYNNYISCRFNKYDHGVVSGIWLYHDLCEYRRSLVELLGKDYEDRSIDGKSYSLFWGKELEELFMIASWTICCHNIFYEEKFDVFAPCYRHHHLDKLLYINKVRNIDVEKHPLLFLLCLADSIEPTKILGYEHLDKVDVIFDSNSIKFSFDPNIENIVCKSFSHKLSELDKWLVDVDEDLKIILKRNEQ